MIQFTQSALRRLAIPLGVAVILAGVGITALTATDRFASETRREYGAARTERAGIQSRLARATDEERDIRARLVDYQGLRTRGVLGDERRLDWVETIKAIKAERRLYDVKYTIEPRRLAEYAGFKPAPGVDVLMSRMRLQSELLHEGDLVALLGDLRQRLAPVVVVRSCNITRVAGRGLDSGAGARLTADCIVDLVTLRDAQEKQ